jgi:hypothetical protein
MLALSRGGRLWLSTSFRLHLARVVFVGTPPDQTGARARLDQHLRALVCENIIGTPYGESSAILHHAMFSDLHTSFMYDGEFCTVSVSPLSGDKVQLFAEMDTVPLADPVSRKIVLGWVDVDDPSDDELAELDLPTIMPLAIKDAAISAITLSTFYGSRLRLSYLVEAA